MPVAPGGRETWAKAVPAMRLITAIRRPRGGNHEAIPPEKERSGVNDRGFSGNVNEIVAGRGKCLLGAAEGRDVAGKDLEGFEEFMSSGAGMGSSRPGLRRGWGRSLRVRSTERVGANGLAPFASRLSIAFVSGRATSTSFSSISTAVSEAFARSSPSLRFAPRRRGRFRTWPSGSRKPSGS